MEQQASYSRNKAILWILFTVFVVLLLDQGLKFHIKTTMFFGQEKEIIGSWFRFHFTENPGMAFGLQPFGGDYGKVILTLFRLLASGVIIYYLRSLIREKAPLALILLVSLILAGALGNIIDSVFYGLIFSASDIDQLAVFMPEGGGYAPLFKGHVVDMLYFPLVDTYLPEWMPWKGGERFEFFRPVFNIADASISTGVFTIIVFRRKLFKDYQSIQPEADSVTIADHVIEEENIASEANNKENSGPEPRNSSDATDEQNKS